MNGSESESEVPFLFHFELLDSTRNMEAYSVVRLYARTILPSASGFSVVSRGPRHSYPSS
jgi:hypothetical protein